MLVDDNNLGRLEKIHDETLGVTVDRHAELRNAKGLMTDRNFEGEFTTLLNIATDLARCNGIDVPQDDIRYTLRELLIAFPVYRTYGTADGLTAPDVALLNRVVASVDAPEPALSLLVRILRRRPGRQQPRCGLAVQNPLPAAYRAADGEIGGRYALFPP